MQELAKKPRDWRYCTCGHQPDDHNPISFACFLCDCGKWTADLEKSRETKRQQEQQATDRDLYNRILARVSHLDI